MTSTDAPAAIAPAPPVLAEVVRSGFTEGHHRGSLVLLAADGSVERTLGDPDAPVFPRSSNKPMQAAAILRAGLELSGERLALAAASHSGEPFHLELVAKMLAEHGLSAADLQTPPDLPLDPVAAEAYLAAGNVRERITMNCSGKHAAMLAVCVRNGWDTATYLDPAHPLQLLVGQVVAAGGGHFRLLGRLDHHRPLGQPRPRRPAPPAAPGPPGGQDGDAHGLALGAAPGRAAGAGGPLLRA
ncbi:hypothetical protein SMICM17S_12901 [Streptomyces microflavus]